MIYIFWTCANLIEAKTLIYELLEQKKIACGSIIEGVTSIYRWQGKVEEGVEVKVILKTLPTHFEEIEAFIRKKGSYEIPEIVQVDASRVSTPYLGWLLKACSKA